MNIQLSKDNQTKWLKGKKKRQLALYIFFSNTIFVSSLMYRENPEGTPSNRRLYEHGIFQRLCDLVKGCLINVSYIYIYIWYISDTARNLKMKHNSQSNEKSNKNWKLHETKSDLNCFHGNKLTVRSAFALQSRIALIHCCISSSVVAAISRGGWDWLGLMIRNMNGRLSPRLPGKRSGKAQLWLVNELPESILRSWK